MASVQLFFADFRKLSLERSILGYRVILNFVLYAKALNLLSSNLSAKVIDRVLYVLDKSIKLNARCPLPIYHIDRTKFHQIIFLYCTTNLAWISFSKDFSLRLDTSPRSLRHELFNSIMERQNGLSSTIPILFKFF